MSGDTLAASCLARLLEMVSAHRAELAASTFITIQERYGLPMTQRPESRTPGVCGVDGAYFTDPPRIVVAASQTLERRKFTALHELAHHLIRNCYELFVLAGRRGLEEAICDQFAAEILAPQALCDEVLRGQSQPTGAMLLTLYQRSHASRTVCARRLAQRLRRPGHVVIARGTVVTYCASQRIPFRAGYGTEQGEPSLFSDAVERGAAAGDARLLYGDGFLSPVFAADAVYDDAHVFAVFLDPETS
jgi:Zn-dependent peptidase ImmA (M78 family)